MASIRKTKKDINVITYYLLSKSFALKRLASGAEDDKFDAIIRKIVYLRNDLIRRINHPEYDAESNSLKKHYEKVKVDLYELMNSVEELKTEWR